MGEREERLMDELREAASRQREADGDLAQAVLAALAAGTPAAEVAREGDLPYRRVLQWRRYA